MYYKLEQNVYIRKIITASESHYSILGCIINQDRVILFCFFNTLYFHHLCQSIWFILFVLSVSDNWEEEKKQYNSMSIKYKFYRWFLSWICLRDNLFFFFLFIALSLSFHFCLVFVFCVRAIVVLGCSTYICVLYDSAILFLFFFVAATLQRKNIRKRRRRRRRHTSRIAKCENALLSTTRKEKERTRWRK